MNQIMNFRFSFGKKFIFIALSSLIAIASIFLTGCKNDMVLDPMITVPVATKLLPQPTSTVKPTVQIGLEESPIIIGYITPGNPETNQNLSELMLVALADKTGYAFSFTIFEDPKEAFDQLQAGEVHFIFIQPLTYLAASERDLIIPLLVSNHFGLYNYGTQFFANQDSGFASYFDEKTNETTALADIALRQFEGKRPCLTDPSSISGTIMPQGLLTQNGISFLEPAFLQNPSGVVRALYIKGICDFGSTYAYSGDPRTSSQVINDLPDVLNRIVIIWQSEAIIPNLGLSASASVPAQVQSDVKNAFLNLILDENGKTLISDALQYDVQGFLTIEDDYYGAFRDLVKSAKVNPYQHLGY